MTVPAVRPGVEGPKKVAIVVHQEHSRPGRVGALLEKRGYELHRLCPNLGCNLPEDMSDYAGVVIFGGPMSANDCGTLGRHQVRARVDSQGGRGGRAVPRPLPRRPAAHPRGRRPGRRPSRGPGRGGLCRHRADACRRGVVQGADEGLRVASRRHGRAGLLRGAGDQRALSGAGLPLSARTRSASSSIPRSRSR